MALRLIDAMATTPKYTTKVLGKDSCTLQLPLPDAPLPPAPPRNPRHVIPADEHDACVSRIHHASLTSMLPPHSKHSQSRPILSLGVQHRRHSAPAMLAFQQAFEKMKEKGSSSRNLTTDKNTPEAAKPPSSAAMDKLDTMFPTSPMSLQKKKARRRLHQVDLGSGKNATFSPKGKKNTSEILASLYANSGSSSDANASGFGKTASSGKLLLGHAAAGMPRTSSGARLAMGSLRKVRSSGYIQF